MIRWEPLESNPDTFNSYLSNLGISGVDCVDVLSFDDESLSMLPKKQLAMILCYPSYKKVDEIMSPVYSALAEEGKTSHDGVFFMKQKISNACGTFALFHALANLEGKINLGEGAFAKFLEAAKGVSEEERSNLLAADAAVATAHEKTAAGGQTAAPVELEHHFIAYVVRNGFLYEIDSRAPFPRVLGENSGDQLVKDAGKACRHLMEKLENVSFAAMALVKNE